MKDERPVTLAWSGKNSTIGDRPSLAKAALKAQELEPAHTFARGEIHRGDNLEILAALSEQRPESVTLAYLDPPFLTGRLHAKIIKGESLDHRTTRVAFDDRWSDRAAYLQALGDRITETRKLLAPHGSIVVHVDTKTSHYVKVMMDEIFGDENRQGIICWRRRYNQPNDKTKMIAKVAEFIVAYARDARALKASGVGKVDLTGAFANPDGDLRGDWASKPWKVGSDQSGSRYVITTPAGVTYDETWMGEEETFHSLCADDRIVFPARGRGAPRKKYFRKEREIEGQCATNWWHCDSFGHNQGANAQLTRLFGVKNVFSNPKPLELLRGLLQIGNLIEDDWVLDFFAGSGTTGHAVTAMNAEDGGRRRFILVQAPAPVPEGAPARALGLPTIPDILRERLRRAGADFRSLRFVPKGKTGSPGPASNPRGRHRP